MSKVYELLKEIATDCDVKFFNIYTCNIPGPLGQKGWQGCITGNKVVVTSYKDIINYNELLEDFYCIDDQTLFDIDFVLNKANYRIRYNYSQDGNIVFTEEKMINSEFCRHTTFYIKTNTFQKHIDMIASQIATESLFEKI
jgi:hypothetical protein